MPRLFRRRNKAPSGDAAVNRHGQARPGSLVLVLLVLGSLSALAYGYRHLEELNAHLSTSKQVNLNLRQELDQLRESSVRYQSDIADYQNKLKELENWTAERGTSLAGLREVEARLRQERQSLREKVAELERSRAEMEAALAKYNTSSSATAKDTKPVTDLKTAIDKAEEDAYKYKKESIKLQKEVADLQQKIKESQERRKTDIKGEREQLTAAYQREKADLQEKIKALSREIEMLTGDSGKALEMREKARDDLNKALEELKTSNTQKEKLIRESAAMHYNLGVLFLQRADYERAVKELEKTLSLMPDDSDAHYNLALIYDEQFKDSAKALQHYREYLKLEPDTEDALTIRKWIIDKESELRIEE